MKYFKNTATALFALVSNIALAGTMGPICSQGNVTVPCPHNTWDVGVQALYLQPTSSSGSFFSNHTSPSGIVNWYGFDPDWGWGLKLEGSYHFRTGNDININWYHFNNSNNNSFSPGILGTPTTPYTLNTTINPRWDAVNAEFGQLVHFGEYKQIRFHGGAQYTQITTNFSDSSLLYSPEQLNIRYRGFGPRIGADMSYNWGHGFAMYANGATALLVGTNQFNVLTTGAIDTAGLSIGSSTTIVPEIEGKLGAKYTYAMPQGDLSLDIGYLWQNYINAQAAFSANSVISGSTDFGLNGPYIGLKWLG